MTVRRLSLLALLVTLSLTTLSCTRHQSEKGIGADPGLAALTVQLVAHPGSDDGATLRLLFAEQDRSVVDMSTMGVVEFTRVHRRGPSSQATLMGRWLGRANRVVSGPSVTDQIEQAAEDALIDLPHDPQNRDAAELLEALALNFNARMPNEPDDNPANPAAENLRSTFQSSFVTEREG